MEMVSRHLLSGDRTLDLWIYPEATPADRVEGPALDRAQIQLLFKRWQMAASFRNSQIIPHSALSPLPIGCRARRSWTFRSASPAAEPCAAPRLLRPILLLRPEACLPLPPVGGPEAPLPEGGRRHHRTGIHRDVVRS